MASIEVRSKDGKTRFIVRYRSEEGKHKGRSFYTMEQAENWRALLEQTSVLEAETSLDDDAAHLSKWTVKEWFERSMHERQCSSGTAEGYAIVIANFPERLGKLPIEALTTKHLRLWLEAMGKEYARGTVDRHAGFVVTALEEAVTEGILVKNPMRGVKLSRLDVKPSRQIVAFERHEIDLALDAIDPHYRLFLRFLFATGLRFGEATALQVSDFSYGVRKISVTKAWKVEAKGHRKIGPPKSKAGYRTVGVSQDLADALKEHVEGLPADSLLFRNEAGNRIQQALFERRFKVVQEVILKTTGKHVTPHTCRHTFVTTALQSHPVHVVSQLAGHANAAVTYQTYSHLLSTDALSVADTMGF